MMGRRWVAWVLVVGASLFACSDGGPVAGEIEVVLDTVHPNLGAIRFVVLSAEPAAIDSVTAGCSGCGLFQRRVGTTEVRGIVTGNLTNGTVLRIAVPDMAFARSYAISVQEAATLTYDALPPFGISLIVATPPR